MSIKQILIPGAFLWKDNTQPENPKASESKHLKTDWFKWRLLQGLEDTTPHSNTISLRKSGTTSRTRVQVLLGEKRGFATSDLHLNWHLLKGRKQGTRALLCFHDRSSKTGQGGTSRWGWCSWTWWWHNRWRRHSSHLQMGKRTPWKMCSRRLLNSGVLCTGLWWWCSFGTQRIQGNLRWSREMKWLCGIGAHEMLFCVIEHPVSELSSWCETAPKTCKFRVHNHLIHRLVGHSREVYSNNPENYWMLSFFIGFQWGKTPITESFISLPMKSPISWLVWTPEWSSSF